MVKTRNSILEPNLWRKFSITSPTVHYTGEKITEELSRERRYKKLIFLQTFPELKFGVEYGVELGTDRFSRRRLY